MIVKLSRDIGFCGLTLRKGKQFTDTELGEEIGLALVIAGYGQNVNEPLSAKSAAKKQGIDNQEKELDAKGKELSIKAKSLKGLEDGFAARDKLLASKLSALDKKFTARKAELEATFTRKEEIDKSNAELDLAEEDLKIRADALASGIAELKTIEEPDEEADEKTDQGDEGAKDADTDSGKQDDETVEQ